MDLFNDRMITWGGEIEWYWIFAIVMGGVALIFGVITSICCSLYYRKARQKDKEKAARIVEEKARKLVHECRKSVKPNSATKGEKDTMRRKKARATSVSSRVKLPPLDKVSEEGTLSKLADAQNKMNKLYGGKTHSKGAIDQGNLAHGTPSGGFVQPSGGHDIEVSNAPPSGEIAQVQSYYNQGVLEYGTPSGGMVLPSVSRDIEVQYAPFSHEVLINKNYDSPKSSPRYQVRKGASPGGILLRDSDHGIHKQKLAISTPGGHINKHGAHVHVSALVYEPARSLTPTNGTRTRMEPDLESDSGSAIELRKGPVAGLYAPKNSILVETSSESSSGVGSSLLTIDTHTNIVAPREGVVVEETDYEALTRKLCEQLVSLDPGYDNTAYDDRLEETV